MLDEHQLSPLVYFEQLQNCQNYVIDIAKA
jgi:hypothetical protein